MTAPDPGLTDLLAADLNSYTWGNEYENAAHEEHTFDGGCMICRKAIGAIVDRVALVVEQHTNGRTTELGWDELVAAIPDGWELQESAQLEEVSRVRQRGLEASQATTARWRARAEKAEATIARVGAVIEDLVQNIADDEKTLRSPNVSVGEAQELPAVINVQKIYLKDLRAALEGEQR